VAEAFSKDGLLHVVKDDAKHAYQINSILGTLGKGGGLTWWAMKVGVEGLMTLIERGELKWEN
jgi:hypothetical protein